MDNGFKLYLNNNEVKSRKKKIIFLICMFDVFNTYDNLYILNTLEKTIQINPLFSRQNKKNKKLEKKDKRKYFLSIKPNDVKKQLMNKIKEYQKKKRDLNQENIEHEKKDNNNENFQKIFQTI